MGRWLRALALLIACTCTVAADDARPTLPAALDDVYGKRVDVAELAAKHRLVVVTLKAAWCPVCRGQLERLREALPRLRSCGATFIVLAPGPRDALRAVADATGFPYPFVEDRDLAIARAADLVLAPDQIVPAILVANARREIVWMDRGRNPTSFNDPALLKELECPPDQVAASASAARAMTGVTSAPRSAANTALKRMNSEKPISAVPVASSASAVGIPVRTTPISPSTAPRLARPRGRRCSAELADRATAET
jgi:peroxiredoxin